MSFGEPLTTLLTVLLSVLLLVRFFRNNQRQKGRLPPGPPALPIIGNLFQLDLKAPHKSLIKLSEQYGPVFTFWFSSFPAVVVCGAEAIREALIGHGYDFSGRYLLPIIKKISDGYGVAFSSGERWKQLQRFTLSTLRNFGMGKESVEERIQEEAQFLVTSFRDKIGEPFNPNFLLRCATSNIICSITFGKRFDYEDKQLLWLTELVAENARNLTSPWIQVYNNFPRFMNFLPGPHQKIFQNMENLKSFLAKTIQNHKETVPKDSLRDYIDCFLMKMAENKDELNSEFFQENLLMTALSLSMAGTETTSTTLRWALQILAKYPEVQEPAYSVTMSFGEPLTTLLVVFLSVLLLVRFFLNKQRQKGRLPPGPPALPIVGNLFQLDLKAPHKTLNKLSEQYGPVFTFWFGSFPAVVVCGAEAMSEALIGHGYDFSGRYLLPILKKISDGYGVAFSSGERWKQLRKFTLSTLRNFGMGKKSVEERIQEEAQFLVTSFRDKKGEPFNPNFLLRCATSNIICSITFGKRFDYEDEQFLWLTEMVAEMARNVASPCIQLYNAFPRIMDFLPGPHQKFFQNVEHLRSFLAKTIQNHKETVQKDSPRDYIDCFLTKMDEDKDELNSEFFHENLLVSTQSLFLAGTETTSTTLCWALQILAKYPEIQEKIHKEIDDVIGSHRRPTIEDRAKMPYTDAVIHEVQRYIDISPMSLPHMATSDVNFRGYLIPKGMLVIPVLSSVLKDNNHWESPESFNAGHFLDENGCFKKSENFVPFSAGKRMCLGESLARMELFLFLTTLLQNFVFKPVIDCKDVDISPDASGILVVPHVYEFYAVPH